MAAQRFFLQRLASTRAGRRLAREIVAQARATLTGEERIPRSGGALLVGNHALGGLDAFPLTALLALRTG